MANEIKSFQKIVHIFLEAAGSRPPDRQNISQEFDNIKIIYNEANRLPLSSHLRDYFLDKAVVAYYTQPDTVAPAVLTLAYARTYGAEGMQQFLSLLDHDIHERFNMQSSEMRSRTAQQYKKNLQDVFSHIPAETMTGLQDRRLMHIRLQKDEAGGIKPGVVF